MALLKKKENILLNMMEKNMDIININQEFLKVIEN